MIRTIWLFRIAIVLAGLVLCYLAATMALSGYLQDRSALLALRLAPFDAKAQAEWAATLIETDQSPGALGEARNLASEALSREPINVLALRTLGLASSFDGDEATARDYFGLASALTKRDLAAQLWWIEQEVADGDIAGALTYYDQALRTSRRANEMLLPVLAEAATEPLVAQKLVPLLARRPAYFRQLFIQASDGASDVTGLAAIARQVLDRTADDDHDLINRIIMRFGRDGHYDAAWDMFGWAAGDVRQAGVVDGSFDRPTPFRLFNWENTPSDTLTAEVAPRGDTDSLYLIASVSRGLAARQLLHLAPGRYRLQALVGDVPDALIDRPTIALSCADGGTTVLEPEPFPASPSGQQARLQALFTVGAGCRYQWLDLAASAASQDEVRAWIDDISIRPNR